MEVAWRCRRVCYSALLLIGACQEGERHSNRHSLILHGRAAPRQNMYSFSERRQYHANAVYDDASVLDINMSRPLPVSWVGKRFEITAALLVILLQER